MFTSLALAALLSDPAHGCGGFFCSGGGSTTTTGTTTSTLTGGYGIVPVVQDAERILFRVNEDESITTFVEVAFEQREDVEFAWIIPIPDAIPVQEVSTADASMFNALELATAPSFTFQWTETNTVRNYNYSYNYGYYGRPGGCSTMGCSAESGMKGTARADTGWVSTLEEEVEEKSSVTVLEDAVVGPFAIEVIQAMDGEEFAVWLDANGYDLPETAVAPLQHYIDLGMSFLGVKLAPEVPAGPVDTLVFTCPAPQPMIPLILTSIASADDLDIIAYVLAEESYVPTNWDLTRDFAPETLPVGGGQTDYLPRVEAETGVYGGQAFVLEFAGDTEQLEIEDLLINAKVKQYPRLTRFRGRISPWEMTLDPTFGPFPGLQDYDREHLVQLDQPPPGATTRRRSRDPGRDEVDAWFRRGQGAWLILVPFALIAWAGRRRPGGGLRER